MHGPDSFGISTVLRPDWLVCRANATHAYNIMAGLSNYMHTFVQVVRVGVNGHPAARTHELFLSGASNFENCSNRHSKVPKN